VSALETNSIVDGATSAFLELTLGGDATALERLQRAAASLQLEGF
jgi:hypothetical protein